MHDGVRSAVFEQMLQAQLAWKPSELGIEQRVGRRLEPAVAMHGLLPVRHRVQHVRRLIPYARKNRELRDDKRLGLSSEPPIRLGDLDAEWCRFERNGGELADEQRPEEAGEDISLRADQSRRHPIEAEAGKDGDGERAEHHEPAGRANEAEAWEPIHVRPDPEWRADRE